MCNVTTPSAERSLGSAVKSPSLTLNPTLELSSTDLKLLALGAPATRTVLSAESARALPSAGFPASLTILSLALSLIA